MGPAFLCFFFFSGDTVAFADSSTTNPLISPQPGSGSAALAPPHAPVACRWRRWSRIRVDQLEVLDLGPEFLDRFLPCGIGCLIKLAM